MAFKPSNLTTESDYNVANSGSRHFRFRYEGNIEDIVDSGTDVDNSRALYTHLEELGPRSGDTFQLFTKESSSTGAFDGVPTVDPLTPASKYYSGFIQIVEVTKDDDVLKQVVLFCVLSAFKQLKIAK